MTDCPDTNKLAKRAIFGMIAESTARGKPDEFGATLGRLLDMKLIERTPNGIWRATRRGAKVLAQHRRR